MINAMVVVSHPEASNPENETEEIIDVKMQNAYTPTEVNYNTNSGDNHHSHENNNYRINIGSSHTISIQGRVEIINITYAGPSGPSREPRILPVLYRLYNQ